MKYNLKLLSTLAVLLTSSTASSASEDKCNDILASGVFNQFEQTASGNLAQSLKDHICYNQSSSSSSGSSNSRSFNLNYGKLDIGLGGNGSANDKASFSSKYCRDTNYSHSYQYSDHILTSVASPHIVEAWRSCMIEKKGANEPLLCYTDNKSDSQGSVTITIDYHTYIGDLTINKTDIRNLTSSSNFTGSNLLFGKTNVIFDTRV